MENKDKIKLKIKALLSKTTENGASQEEALSALSKAQELMKNYFVSENDLQDPFIGEKCILNSTPLIKSGYDTSLFYNELSDLFDCEYYFTNKKIYFFGFEPDVELCIYFYDLITKACLNEKKKYMKSKDYAILKTKYHGKTLASSFIKGFLIKVARKMYDLYAERKSELNRNSTHGLMVVKKKNKVTDAFKDLGMNISTTRQKDLQYERLAFSRGVLKGNEFEITQGISKNQNEKTLQLSM